MTSNPRYFKEHNKRFWVRIAVPKSLVGVIGKGQITEYLGGDRAVALNEYYAAVVRLQGQIVQAKRSLDRDAPSVIPEQTLREISASEITQATWSHYTQTLQDDTEKRAAMPNAAEIEAERERFLQRLEAGEARNSTIATINLATDFELKAQARSWDSKLRKRRLTALKTALGTGETRWIDHAVQQYIDDNLLSVQQGSKDWDELAHNMMRAEVEALSQTLKRDTGDYSEQISDPIIKPAERAPKPLPPELLKPLFRDYIASRQAIGKHGDGGANWEHPIEHLIGFLGHGDARRITKRNLLDWRDTLMKSGKAPKTVSDKYLAAIRAVLRWAHENDRLPTNEAQAVKQEVPRKKQTRETGYTTDEAIKLLRASVNYQPKEADRASNRESPQMTAAKRWVPLLCAFTGARVTEMTQLRKSDVRKEGDHWIVRITPDAGTVKSGHYRDVPLHRQVLALGFMDYVNSAASGPLFHGATSADKYLAGARATSGRLSEWLNSLKLVPQGVQPSHGWRHRFKTIGLDAGAQARVLDGIQGHAGRSASDGYGDVTIVAKVAVIDALPDYDLGA